MNMRLNQAGYDQASRSIQFRRTNLESRRNSYDGSALEADIDGPKFAFLQNPGATNDKVHQSTAAGRAPRYALSSIVPRNSAAAPSATTRPPPST